jgi:septal ring factor EnvC (AmiA/AmiB activator)
MARKTIAELERVIDSVKTQRDELASTLIEVQRSNKGLESTIKSKDTEIHKLRRHVGFVHAQRDRLVGFIQGRESVTTPKVEQLDNRTYPPQVQKIDRVERFLDECCLRFVNDDDNCVTVQNDPFRRN